MELSRKTNITGGFFEKGERPNDKIAEDSKTANEKKATLKENTKSPT